MILECHARDALIDVGVRLEESVAGIVLSEQKRGIVIPGLQRDPTLDSSGVGWVAYGVINTALGRTKVPW